MSDAPDRPAPQTPELAPHRPTVVMTVPPQPRGTSCLGVAFGLSFLTNLVLAGLVLVLVCMGLFKTAESPGTLGERYHSGDKKASDKVAIIEVDGIILEGLLDYPQKQIEAAARDSSVKAVVLRVNSPGGSIGASDDLWRRLERLRDGTLPLSTGKKPLFVSMGSLTASGGYYISMAAPRGNVFAEPTTITGSIGVYAALPNVAELADKIGFKMEVIKRGEVKDSGSPFKRMSPEERAVWQDSIDDAFNRFLGVVEKGRGLTRVQLRTPVIDEERTAEGWWFAQKKFRYVRRRADGGIYSAEQAKKFALIDAVLYLDQVIARAAEQAGIKDHYRAIHYEKPKNLAEVLLGVQSSGKPGARLDAAGLSSGLTPRLWYLAPQSELAAIAASLEQRP
jgi:protease IV